MQLAHTSFMAWSHPGLSEDIRQYVTPELHLRCFVLKRGSVMREHCISHRLVPILSLLIKIYIYGPMSGAERGCTTALELTCCGRTLGRSLVKIGGREWGSLDESVEGVNLAERFLSLVHIELLLWRFIKERFLMLYNVLILTQL